MDGLPDGLAGGPDTAACAGTTMVSTSGFVQFFGSTVMEPTATLAAKAFNSLRLDIFFFSGDTIL
ncbi:hypothetical protein [Hoeflea prorocentri]|uniref:Uncharacterized protein n=1 Tax=Hoeflea prorocentri TaxID=1922333 RepID=A0A9X3UMK6_9HYPH|nr:hypothetical protein [Hoeflea prorocentri]MCY6383437.1 hypothetical protein [Hoeflea prorocentri]MDA5401237.1 hypothetical protein [Hoeflea prorocentri]